MNTAKNLYYIFGGCLIWTLLILTSCAEEREIGGNNEVFISVKGTKATNPGDLTEDYKIKTIRILAFEREGERRCISNESYPVADDFSEEVIEHKIKAGIYDLVFLANEPEEYKTTLELVFKYNDLNTINFPYSAFTSDAYIPMIQEIGNISVIGNYNITLELVRLAARVDITLQAKQNLEDVFTGITLNNIAGQVPLMGGYLTDFEPAQTLEILKDEFTTVTDFTSEQDAAGIIWAKKYSRIIIPSKNFIDPTEEEKAMVLTVRLDGQLDASCPLKTASEPADNFTLPANSYLDVTGTILDTRTLDLNVKVMDWKPNGGEWNIPSNRILNVSETEVSITDYNGARIFFWSNMPIVRVLPDMKKYDQNGNEMGTVKTNTIFNTLSRFRSGPESEMWKFTERFSHDPATGHGYMDIVMDRVEDIGVFYYDLVIVGSEKEYIESGVSVTEQNKGLNRVYRTIRVRTEQNGVRYFWDATSPDLPPNPLGYVGAFYKHNETGERIISGIRWSVWDSWSATTDDDFIILSTSPSQDPYVGTNQPGDPENFPVIPNSQKNETGKSVQGVGRVYFRIGLTGTINPDEHRYGTVHVNLGSTSMTMYVRQGEAPDFIMAEGNGGAAFSPYNLIVKQYKDNPYDESDFYIVGQPDPIYSTEDQDVVFVDYPTQGGSHFQWATTESDGTAIRKGYHPVKYNLSSWNTPVISGYPFWDPENGTKYKDEFEYCPPGYHRPSDGPVDRVAVNSFTLAEEQIKLSEWRMSLLWDPMAMQGDGTMITRLDGGSALDGNDTYYYESTELPGLIYGFYADGFFDRRPVIESNQANTLRRGVSIDNAHVAFPGTLFFSPSGASLFIPSAGRRSNSDGALQFAGSTGYYFSSSTAPGYMTEDGYQIKNQVRNFEFGFSKTKPMGIQAGFANSMRCVRD